MGVSTVTFNLQSSAQPVAAGAAVSVGPYTVTVTTGSTGGSSTPTPTGTSTAVPPTTICEPTPAGAGTPFGFRNGTSASNGDTTSQLVSSMTENTCLYQPSGANYSTDAGAGRGRSLMTGGSATTSTASQRAEWLWAPASTGTVSGTATVSVMVLCPTTGSLTLNGAIGTWAPQGTGTWSQQATGSATGFCATPNTWTRVTVPMVISSPFTVNPKVGSTKEQDLSTRLWVTGGSTGQTIRLDYEQSDAKSFLYVSVA
jgi:hypothetical protein